MQTVGNLLSFANEIIYEDSSTSIKVIQTRMIANDISHIPIIDNQCKQNVGLVRRKEIWLWMLRNEGASPDLKDVKEGPLPVVKVGDSLVSAMKKLDGSSAVLIRGENNIYSHFLSPRTVARTLASYSERFQIIEQIENEIRIRLDRLSNEDLAIELNIDEVKMKELTFAQYIEAFSKLWDKLELDYFDRKETLNMMDAVREYRNGVMHFRLEDDDKNNVDTAWALLKILKM